MIRYSILKLVVFCSLLFCVAMVITTNAVFCQESPKKIALLVGVSDYKAEKVEDLKFAENDIRVVGSQLKEMGFEVTSLSGEDATRDKTISTIDSFMEKASELETSDIVLVMFSGHGQQIRVSDGSKVTEVPYFCPVDSLHYDESTITTRGKNETEVGEELNFVSLNRILRGMDENSNSLNNLLVVDACRNNPSKGKASGISGTSANVPSGVNILFAASSGQKSWESEDKDIQHGVFTHFLIKGLQGKAKNSRGQVTWSRLASYLQEEVAFSGPALAGGKDRVQNPHSVINSSNLIVLSKTASKKKSSSAGNWTRFRGENGQGKISYSNIPLQWSETENIRWKYKLPGPGASSPIIFDGQVFVTAHSGYGKYSDEDAELKDLKRHLISIDLKSGQKNWMASVDGAPYEARCHGAHGYSSHSPVTDGEKVYAYFGYSGMFAYDMAGTKLWSRQFEVNKPESDEILPRGRKELIRKFDTNKNGKIDQDEQQVLSRARRRSRSNNTFGGGGSSVIFENLVIVNSGCETEKIHALDLTNGETKWIFDDIALVNNSSTPVVIGGGDRVELVMQLTNKCVGIDATTGKKKWEHEVEGSGWQIASPLVVGENLVFSKSRSSLVFALNRNLNRGEEGIKKTWTSPLGLDSTPIETADALLCFERRGILTVLDKATGETLDQQRLKDLSDKRSGSISSTSSYSSPILVGDHVIAVLGMGDTVVIGKEGDFYKTKFVNRLGDEEETFLATPAVTQNELLIRSDKYLYCISRN